MTKGTRAQRKARNAQRAVDRGRHAASVAASVAAEMDAWQARIEAEAFDDACEVACDQCGLVQVSPKPRPDWMPPFHSAAYGCVVCGCPTGSYVRCCLR